MACQRTKAEINNWELSEFEIEQPPTAPLSTEQVIAELQNDIDKFAQEFKGKLPSIFIDPKVFFSLREIFVVRRIPECQIPIFKQVEIIRGINHLYLKGVGYNFLMRELIIAPFPVLISELVALGVIFGGAVALPFVSYKYLKSQ